MTTGQIIESQLDELDIIRENFIDILDNKGLIVSEDAKLDELVNDVDKLSKTPEGTLNIITNGNNIDVSSYATANVNIKYAPQKISFYRCASNNLDYELANLNIINLTDLVYTFYDCTNITEVDLSNQPEITINNMYYTFSNCGSLKTIKMPTIKNTLGINLGYAFRNCHSLKLLDIRNFTFVDFTGSTNNTFINVPLACEIIVKDNTEKNAFLTIWPNLTNVKTVAEYEAEQNN